MENPLPKLNTPRAIPPELRRRRPRRADLDLTSRFHFRLSRPRIAMRLGTAAAAASLEDRRLRVQVERWSSRRVDRTKSTVSFVVLLCYLSVVET
jgi:hypothetical protein